MLAVRARMDDDEFRIRARSGNDGANGSNERTLVMPLKRKENTRITAETVERMSCPQKPHRPRVLHACEFSQPLGDFRGGVLVLAIVLAAAAFLPRTAAPGVFQESLSASEPRRSSRRAERDASPTTRKGETRTRRRGWRARDATGARGVASGAERDGGGDCAERHGVARETAVARVPRR